MSRFSATELRWGIFPPKQTVELIRQEFPEGARVRAVRFGLDAASPIDDNQTVPSGTEGTVRNVDDAGTVHVKWDNGRSIGVLVAQDDEIELVKGD